MLYVSTWIVVLLYLLFSIPVVLLDCNTHSTRDTCLTRHSTGQTCQWSAGNRCHDAKPRLSTDGRKSHPAASNGSSAYTASLAYNYTLLSALAYSKNPKKCLPKILPDSDFVLQQGIGSHCEDLRLFNYQECYAYTAVSNKSKTILVAYRGTTFPHKSSASQLIDQIITALLVPKQPFLIGGKVQQYFKNAHNKLSPCVEKSVRGLMVKYAGYQVAVTGHSLGAALASLSAASLVYKGIVKRDNMSVYQFGEPRVGDGNYARAFDTLVPNSWRVVHNRDIVSHIPTCNLVHGCSMSGGGPYHTKTEVFYPNIDMNVTSPYKICASNEDERCSDGLIRKDWCTTDMGKCVEYHKQYFGVPVGTLCDGKPNPLKEALDDQDSARLGFNAGQRLRRNNCYVSDL